MFFATYDDLCARARCFDVEQRGRATVKTPLERLLCASLADDLSGRFSISNRFEKFRKGTDGASILPKPFKFAESLPPSFGRKSPRPPTIIYTDVFL